MKQAYLCQHYADGVWRTVAELATACADQIAPEDAIRRLRINRGRLPDGTVDELVAAGRACVVSRQLSNLVKEGWVNKRWRRGTNVIEYEVLKEKLPSRRRKHCYERRK